MYKCQWSEEGNFWETRNKKTPSVMEFGLWNFFVGFSNRLKGTSHQNTQFGNFRQFEYVCVSVHPPLSVHVTRNRTQKKYETDNVTRLYLPKSLFKISSALINTSKKVFCVIMLIFGALLYATIFGNVTTIIQQIYAGKFTYLLPVKQKNPGPKWMKPFSHHLSLSLIN